MKTAVTNERLRALDHEIAQAEAVARAERAFSAANPGAPNPWNGAAEKLSALEMSREQCVLELEGQRLSGALAQKRELEERLERLTVERQCADRAVRERAAHETVVRYLRAGAVCRERGWGWSWTRFQAFFESKRERFAGLAEDAAFFLDSTQARDAGVRFDLGSDREAVRLYLEAVDAANKALCEWTATAEQLRLLLREHPELQGA